MIINEEIGALDVSMDVLVVMHVGQHAQELLQQPLDLDRGKPDRRNERQDDAKERVDLSSSPKATETE